MGLRWQTLGDLAAFRRGSVGESALRAPRGWNLVGIFAGKAFFIKGQPYWGSSLTLIDGEATVLVPRRDAA